LPGSSGAQYILLRIPGTGIGFIKYLGQPFRRHVHTATINTVNTPTVPSGVPPKPPTRNQEILAAISAKIGKCCALQLQFRRGDPR
jgi:hypothetical protein